MRPRSEVTAIKKVEIKVEELSMSIRTITAMFDSADAASRARDRLLEVGLPSENVQVMYQGDGDNRAGTEHKGFWESITDFFTDDDDDRATYEEGIRRGGHLLTARVGDEYAEDVIRLLENSDAIDLDKRADEWRAEGWNGASSVQPVAGKAVVAEGQAVEANRAGSEEAIPVVQERLRVGKREVNRGGVRVRSYVVEEPVEEQVNLREERVDVERRPVGQRVRAGAADDLLRDRTIEMTESAEEAVVSKDAEVVEEVVVRKFEGERTEGVSDTVRRTEVDVEDTRADDTTGEDAIPPAGTAGKRSRSTRTERPSRN
jgi:uncharacterized protein (TIGR02271 family)